MWSPFNRRRAALVAAVGVVGALASLVGVAPAQAATPPVPVVSVEACPTSVPDGSLRDGSDQIGARALCGQAVAFAATQQAKDAIRAAFHMLGSAYACDGTARLAPTQFDCSSLVSRAYALAGVDTAGPGWSSSTRDMVPWGGAALASWASYVAPSSIRPGDLVLYATGGATYRHVAMYLGNGFMLHTSTCGDVAHISSFWGFDAGGRRTFLVARRVVMPGEARAIGPRVSDRASVGDRTSASPAGVAAFPGGVLVRGASGPAVASVQRALIRLGYTIPGVQAGQVPYGGFGQQTLDAVRLYQREHPAVGPVTGRITQAAYRTLTGWRPAASGSSASSARASKKLSLSRVLRHAAASVMVVQAALNRVVDAGLPINGRWGPMTQAAFDQFRHTRLRLRGAAATGAPGAGSLAALGRLAGFSLVA
ncbi:MAG: hypothetical protein F2881_04075 [Actinobacteria bacterium]|uniref:Unannotated protein n=1 Tax=freshwater metagenome TaxID=449393 RepID=A0A6J7PEY3_9ZZZZ|nr:hypothetical protein [Actinomycetota bacterium]